MDHLTARDPRSFKDISFQLRKGEILGIGGLVGAQRTELVEAIFGLRAIASGTIQVNGKPVSIRSSQDAISHGIGFITEDRRGSGIFPLLSIVANTAMPSLGRFQHLFGVLNHRKIFEASRKINDQMRTKTPSCAPSSRTCGAGTSRRSWWPGGS